MKQDRRIFLKEEDVSPGEDLTREHGALNRILLIYEEGIRRLTKREDFIPELLRTSARLIKKFIENYHEELDEEFLFPRFRKAQKHVELVNTLEAQHKAGRNLTTTREEFSTVRVRKDDLEKTKLLEAMRLFIRMYHPHESREDTILFPAFHSMLTSEECDALGNQFEDKEYELFGKDGFEGVIGQIAEIERKFGIYYLDKFTPIK